MSSDRWAIRYRQPPDLDRATSLDVNREAQIRQLHEELGREETLAAKGAHAAIGDLLVEIGRLRRLLPEHQR